MLSVRYSEFIFSSLKSILDVMSSVVKLMMGFLAEIHGYHRIRNMSNDLFFANDYFILVHLKTILKTIDMKTFFDEM